jgi:sugar phosphate isomerase/epimerase
MRCFVLMFVLFVSLFPLKAEEKPYAPAIYPFQNGVKFHSVADGLRIVKDLGYQGVGSVYPNQLAEYKAACEEQRLKIFSIYVGGRVNADSFHYEKEVGEAIAMLKGTNALVEINVQRGKDPSDKQAIAMVSEIADKAKAAGLRVVLYPHDNFHIERVDHALKIAQATGRDNVGIAFNLCHFLKVQPTDDLAALLRRAKPLLWSVSLCGADSDGKDWSTLIRPLDEGTFDQAALLRMLRVIGYEGAVGLQCFNIRIDAQNNLSRSIKAWSKHLAASQFDGHR